MGESEHSASSAVQRVVDFLKSNVRKTDIPEIKNELKKDFVLGKTRGKGGRKKSTRKKCKTLTRNEKDILGFYKIPRDSVKYEDVLPIHAMWTAYISSVLDLEKPLPTCVSRNWEGFTLSVYKCDFHGALLKVVRSKCLSYVGKKGICIMDTRNTLKLVSENNLVTTIPKKICVFEMYLKEFKITLFGKHLCTRPADRSTKKVKNALLPDL